MKEFQLMEKQQCRSSQVPNLQKLNDNKRYRILCASNYGNEVLTVIGVANKNIGFMLANKIKTPTLKC